MLLPDLWNRVRRACRFLLVKSSAGLPDFMPFASGGGSPA